MKSKTSFASPSLQIFSSEADSVISNHLRDLDRVSNDIKALEERLKTAGIPFNFTYIFSSEQTRFVRPNSREKLPYPDEFIKHTDHCLVWGKNEGEYRFSYNVYVTQIEIFKYGDGEKVLERYQDGESNLSLSKPLIETKSHFRVKIEKELSSFYKLIIEALKTKRDQENIFNYSPNYPSFVSSKIDPDPDQDCLPF